MNTVGSYWEIYALVDPRSGEVRYIGKTSNRKRRLSKHISESRFFRNRSPHKENWIRELIREDMLPEYLLLEAGYGPNWGVSERAWIEKYNIHGRLTNQSQGGEGTEGSSLSREARIKIGNAHRGKKLSPEHKSAFIKAGKSEKAKENWLISIKSKPPRKISEEHRRILVEVNTGKKMSEESRAKMRGRIKSEDEIRRMSLAKSHPVRCVETGEVFKNAKTTGISRGVSKTAINQSIKGGGTCRGHHWEKFHEIS